MWPRFFTIGGESRPLAFLVGGCLEVDGSADAHCSPAAALAAGLLSSGGIPIPILHPGCKEAAGMQFHSGGVMMNAPAMDRCIAVRMLSWNHPMDIQSIERIQFIETVAVWLTILVIPPYILIIDKATLLQKSTAVGRFMWIPLLSALGGAILGSLIYGGDAVWALPLVWALAALGSMQFQVVAELRRRRRT